MRVEISGGDSNLTPFTRRLLGRMLCPLTGLSQEIGFVARGRSDPRIAVAGGDMTGVHILRGVRPPDRGAYHIGGTGMSYEEAIIRTLGETVERYAQFTAFVSGRLTSIAASLDEMVASERRVLAAPGLQLFSHDQLDRPGFPFARIDGDTPIGWISGYSPIDGGESWSPAQQAAVGYPGFPGEPRFAEGVTTGSAAHTSLARALRNALLELVQIDAAMGHWYASGTSLTLESDARTRALDSAIGRRLSRKPSTHRFHWLKSADLPGFAIACVIEGQEPPYSAVGLGCDLRLGRAMYNAFLEAVAVMQLAKVNLFRQAMDDRIEGNETNGSARHYDLDSNVLRYSLADPALIRDRFGGQSAAASDLPPDVDLGAARDVGYILDAYASSGKRMVCMDLTTDDIRALGFRAVRVWSVDMLTLCLPDAPPVLHLRFEAYGGFAREDPHPYP